MFLYYTCRFIGFRYGLFFKTADSKIEAISLLKLYSISPVVNVALLFRALISFTLIMEWKLLDHRKLFYLSNLLRNKLPKQGKFSTGETSKHVAFSEQCSD